MSETHTAPFVHPSFVRAAALEEPLRAHFPKSVAEAETFEPLIRYRALAPEVLIVARTRVECAWAAYCAAVPGRHHRRELAAVLAYGTKVDEPIARVLFPEFDQVPYAP